MPFLWVDVETEFHILWQCPSAKDVWSVGSATPHKSYFPGLDFIQVVDGIFRKCG
jgi:hypothetical protein